MPPRASILVPTHSQASTLPLSVRSALAQTVAEVEVIIIGDGVTPQVRTAARKLAASDQRVQFLDLPKGENHGEVYRDAAIQRAQSDAIFYLCDDDLLMRDHVADLLELLKRHNFVQSKNGYFTVAGEIAPYPADLANPDSIALHLRTDIVVNGVSITGTAHSKMFYLQAGDPWTTTPSGRFPDHFQWQKLMRNPAFSGATSTRMTALQFPSSSEGRGAWTAKERLAEISEWATIASAPDGQSRVDALVAHGDRAALVLAQLQIDELDRWQHRRGVMAAARVAEFLYSLPLLRHSRRRGS